MTKFQETMSASWAVAFSRLASIVLVPLLGIVAYYYASSTTAQIKVMDDLKEQLGGLATQLVTVSIQIARLEEQGEGGRTNQAIIDAEQNRRLERLEAQRFGSPG